MFKSLLLFSMLVYKVLSIAQTREITGMVIYDGERVSGAIIKDINSLSQTTSTDKGEFAIIAKTGDTLTISKDNFIRDTVVITSSHDLIIQLRKNPSMLRAVTINSTSISPATTYEQNKKDYKEIYFKGDKSHIFLSGSLVNIDQLNNALGKQGHFARRLQRRLTTDYKNDVIDKRFNHLAARVTGYKGKMLSDFILNNRPTYEMVAKASDYDIVQYIKKKLSN